MSIIVVTHESRETIGSCLQSIEEHRPSNSYEVVVVDNASQDGTAMCVATGFPEVVLVEQQSRRGFAANCNLGARSARGNVLLFLNPDARVQRGSVDSMSDLVTSRRDVAIVAPRLIYPDGSWQPSARRFPEPISATIRRTPLRWIWRSSRFEANHLMCDERFDTVKDVDWVLAAAIAMRRRTFEELGGFDERFRLYCEDIDLCWRSWEHGYRVICNPYAVVEHDLGELTRKQFLTRATLWHYKSMAYFLLKHGVSPPRGSPSWRESQEVRESVEA